MRPLVYPGVVRAPPLSAWLSTSLGLALAPLLIGLPLLASGVGELLAWGHDLPLGAALSSQRRARAGAVAIVVLAPAVLFGLVLGAVIVDPIEHLVGDDDRAAAVVALLAPMISALLFAPFVLAPSLVLRTVGPSLAVRAIELAAHVGVGRTLVLGAMLGALGALPFALAIVGAFVDEAVAVLAVPVGVVIDVALAPWALRAIARTADRALASIDDAARSAATLSRLGRFAIAPLALLVATIVLALSTPLPLREDGPIVGGTPTERAPWIVPGTRVHIAYDWRWVDVTREDGASEHYYVGPFLSIDRASARHATRDGREVIVVRLGNDYHESCELVIDPSGRRVDDGLRDRIERRLPAGIVALLVLACSLGVVFAARNGRAQARVREVLAVLSPEREGELVRGVLRTRGSPVLVGARGVHAAGGAWIEADGGALRIALPDEPVAAVAIDPTLPPALLEGTPVLVRSHGARLGGVTLRDAHTPWPAGALAVWGDPQRAATAHVRALFPSLTRLGLAIGVLLVITSLAIAIEIV